MNPLPPNARAPLEPKDLYPFEKRQKPKQRPLESRFSLSRLFGWRGSASYGRLEDAPFVKKSGKKSKAAKVQNEEQKGEGPLLADRRVRLIGHATLDPAILVPKDKYEIAKQRLNEVNRRRALYMSRSGDHELKNDAIILLQEAVEEGYPAMEELAEILAKEPNGLVKAIKWYEQLCRKAPLPSVCCKLGEVYEKGGEGIQADPLKAMQYYRMAIENGYQGYPSYRLALLLEKTGVKENAQEAFHLLKSVASFYEKAAVALARFYEEGIGIEKNMEEAVSLYERLAPSFGECAQRLGVLYDSGYEENGEVVIPRDAQKSFHYYELAHTLPH